MRSSLILIRDTLVSVDVLQEHLTRARASGGVFARSVARPPWGVLLPGTIELAVHAVVRGRGWLWLEDPTSAIELAPGDIALVRGGNDHRVAHSPSARVTADRFQAEHAHDEESDDPAATVFVCGAYQFPGDVGGQMIGALPPVLHFSYEADDPLHDAVQLLSCELESSLPGQQTVLDRLLDVVLVQALRVSFRQGAHAPRWYHASTRPPARTCASGDPY